MASILRVATRRFSTQTSLRQADNFAFKGGPAEAHGEGALWKKLFVFIACPAIAFCTYNGFFSEEANSGHHRPEFVPYSHLRLRVRAFPWGDGKKSLIHSHFNALPDGYEDEEH